MIDNVQNSKIPNFILIKITKRKLKYSYYEQERRCMYNVTLRRFRSTAVCNVKAINITYCEYMFVALGIQHPKGIRRTMFLSVACAGLLYFSTLYH
jgi:hypothetical protein